MSDGFTCKCGCRLADKDNIVITKVDNKFVRGYCRYLCKSCGTVYFSQNCINFIHYLDFKEENV